MRSSKTVLVFIIARLWTSCTCGRALSRPARTIRQRSPRAGRSTPGDRAAAGGWATVPRRTGTPDLPSCFLAYCFFLQLQDQRVALEFVPERFFRKGNSAELGFSAPLASGSRLIFVSLRRWTPGHVRTVERSAVPCGRKAGRGFPSEFKNYNQSKCEQNI